MNAARRDDRTLIRIAAMLVALAVLAERAGSRSLPVRWLVLCILRRAEAVAHAFVVEAIQTNWPCLEEALEVENRPIDAVWLAWRFRVLAAALSALLRLGCRPGLWNACMDCAPRRLASRRLLMTCWRWTREPCDTS